MDNQDEAIKKDTIESPEGNATTENNQQPEADQPTVEDNQSEGNETPDESGTPDESNDSNINNSEARKETRGQRRIKELVGKLKGLDNSRTDSPDMNQFLGPDNQSFIAADEDGGLDPVETQRRYEAQRIRDREIIKQELRAESEFKSTVQDHVNDLERTYDLVKDDEDLHDIVTKRYHDANYFINPYTGQEEFVAKVKMSDIYQDEQRYLNKRIAKAQADTSVRLAGQQDGAIPPGGQSQTASTDYSDVPSEDLWNHPKTVASNIEKKYGYKD